MYPSKNAFTFVELLITISILSILWTIAFISLSHETGNTRNTVMIENMSSLAYKINLQQAKWFHLKDFLKNDLFSFHWVNGSINSSIVLVHNNNYWVWDIDFPSLQLKSDEFQNWDWKLPLFAYANNGRNFSRFQIASNINDKAGNQVSILKWNYYKSSPWDIETLISLSGSNDLVVDGITQDLY